MQVCEASALARVRSLPAGALDETIASGAGCTSEVVLALNVGMIWVRRFNCSGSLRPLETGR